jgi:hypothetical protein
MRYAALVASEGAHSIEKPRSVVEKTLSYLSSGFVLLIIGAIITSGLVPYFQRQYENRKQQYGLMQECFSQFLLYSNSIWQEYYAILPLTQEVEIDKDEYLRYVKEIAQIKLKRYEAYAKVQALSIVFRRGIDGKSNPVESALKNYAVSLNTASAAIDKWLTGLYCTPTKRERSPCASFDPTFDAFTEYENIKKLVVEIGNRESDNVAAIIVAEMKQGK